MKHFISIVFVGMTLPACKVIEYREVQRDFEASVRLDNERTVSPFTDAARDYSEVLEKLTPRYIAGLDDRLQPNAWMIRGVSAWRSRDYPAARVASRRGLALNPPSGSRDAVILTMLPGLGFASQSMDTWREGDQTVAVFLSLQEDLKASWEQIEKAEQLMNAGTPRSTRYYLYYQKWRISANWGEMIGDASNDDFNVTKRLNQQVAGRIGKRPGQARSEAKDQVKGPLLDLIVAQGG